MPSTFSEPGQNVADKAEEAKEARDDEPPIKKMSTMRLNRAKSWADRKASVAALGIWSGPPLPEPLSGASLTQTATVADFPDAAALSRWLQERGVNTDLWGQKNTKDVKSLWKEIHLDECGMELWMQQDGGLQPVRVVHVLRAKVCSQQSFQRGIFLFNTWQQYADGRKRMRNGLLSEKVGFSEMPIQMNLHEICRRAIAEELQQLAPSSFRVVEGTAQPRFGEGGTGVTVEDEHFVDHTIEVEVSKSFPGLMTMYHLYTIEIVCSGLPSVDFNSLEFLAPNGQGERGLKYVHAWTWLPWTDIQRYLLEGSTMKERKCAGSFGDEADLCEWLCGFDVDIEAWDSDTSRSVRDLFWEIQHGKTQLERWGRNDGVNLLMRVVHVLQLEVTSSDPDLAGKVLLQTWSQRKGREVESSLKLVSRSLNLVGAHIPFDEDSIAQAAREVIKEKCTRLVDPHFRMQSGVHPVVEDSLVEVSRVSMGDSRHQVEQSTDYPGLCTLYHIYTVEAECSGLPSDRFGSVDRPLDEQGSAYLTLHNSQFAQGFEWRSWQEYAHMLRSQVSDTHLRQVHIQRICADQQGVLERGTHTLSDMSSVLERIASRRSVEDQDPDVVEAQRLLRDLQMTMSNTSDLKEAVMQEAELSKGIPPSMLSQMKENAIVKPECLQRASEIRREAHRQAVINRALFECGSLKLPAHVELPSTTLHQVTRQFTATTNVGSDSCEQQSQSNTSQPSVNTGLVEEDEDPIGPERLVEILSGAFAVGGDAAQPDAGGGQRIPLDMLVKVLQRLKPDLRQAEIWEACEGLSGGEPSVDCRAFVDWLYE